VACDKLVKNSDGTYTLVKPNQEKYEFDAQGRLVAKTNQIRQQLQLSYTDDQLTAITDPISNTVVSLSYNGNGLINRIIDAGNREYEFTYDSSNNLIEIKNVSLNQTLNYTYNEDGQVLTGSKNGSIIFENTYDEEGRVVVQADGNGNLTYFAYDEETKPGIVITTITDREGNTRIVEHDTNYNLVKAIDENNGTTEYTYDAKGNMLTQKNARGYTTTYTYDERGNLLTIEDAKGRVTRMSYDARNNLTSVEDALGKTTFFTYDSNNRLTLLTDPRGEETSFTYDENGLLLQATLPGGGVTSYTYENGLPETITDPAGVSLIYEYDQAGRIVGITDSAGTTTFTYDAGDKVTSITDPLGNTVTREYDQHGNLIKTTDAQGKVTRYTYDANDNLIALTDALNQTVHYEYDNEGRLKKVIDARGNATTMVYDGVGRMTGVTDPLGNTFKYVYDEEGNLREVSDAYNETISAMTYDEVGNLLETTDALGNTLTSEYDALNRLIEKIDPLGRTTQLAYNENDELTMVTDALGGQSRQDFDVDGNRSLLVNTNNGETTFVYNPAGQLTSISTEAGQQVQFTYNDRGLLASVTNGRGQQATYEYDAVGRVTQYTDPTGTISYTYDANGNLLTVTDAQGTITRAYDDLGRITQYTNADGGQIQYTYDEVGNLITLTYPGGKEVHYTYDAANRLIKVVDWAGRITQYEYDNNGRLTKTIRPNQTALTQTYNVAGQLIEQKDLDKNGRVISSYTFEYDDVGNIVSETSPNLAPSVSPLQIPNIDMTYTEDNRLATFNGQAVQYDADGNMITGPLNGQMSSYTYDSRNRLVTAGNLTYEYDAENNRISVTENVNGCPVKTEYVVNPQAALSQVLMKTVGNEQTYYVYGLGLIGQEVAGEYSTYHFDLRGSTVAITNANGKVTDRYQYSAYGEILSGTGNTDTPFLYNGRDGVMTDANGLYHMRARYYNPQIRRFVSQDILLGVVIDGQSLNRYAYVQGNPVGFVDPLGLARDGLWKDRDGKYSDKVLAELAIYSIIWGNAEAAYNLGLINESERRSIQSYALREADSVRYKADHPIKSKIEKLSEFIIADVLFGDLAGEEIGVAVYTAKGFEKMYSEDNYALVLATSKGFTGGNSKTMYQADIKGKGVRIDIEMPTGGSTGNVHIHVGKEKIFLDNVNDVSKLPKSIRKDVGVVKWVKKAFNFFNKIT